MFKFSKTKKAPAFSLIEVMMAAFLMAVGLLATVSLLTIGVKKTSDNKYNLIASFLAQEGVELVRNIRDTNWLEGEETFSGIGEGNCRIDASSDDNLVCGTSAFELYNGNSLIYKHSGNSQDKTRFSRKIIIANEASGEQKIITSVVVWGEDFPSGSLITTTNCNTANKCAYSKINLTKWQEE